MELRRGDLIEVQWVDITEDPVGDPDHAFLPTRHSVGYFWSGTGDTFVTTMTMDEDVADQSGYCIYPLGVVTGIKIVRKGRGKVYRGSVPYVYAEHPVSGEDSTEPAGSGAVAKHGRASKVRGGTVHEPADVQAVPAGSDPA